MSSFLDKLNLRPQERRLVVIVTIIVFVALNFIFIWPHFGDLALWQQRHKNAEAKLRQYRGEIAKRSNYEKEKRELQGVGAS